MILGIMLPTQLFAALLVLQFFATPCLAQSIEEKRQSLSSTSSSLEAAKKPGFIDYQKELEKLYFQASKLSLENAPSEAYLPLYQKAKDYRQAWQEQIQSSLKNLSSRESEAVWHLPEATVRQLCIDFGGSEAIYIMSDEIAQRKVAVVSSLSLPRQNWSSMLDLILAQVGIGVRQINPYCKELFFIGVSEAFNRITDKREELWLIPDEERVCFVMGSGAVDLKQFARSLSRLVDSSSAQVKPIGSQLAILAPALRVRQILQIYDFMARTEQNKAYRIVNVSRLSADDLQKMLSVIFAQVNQESSGAAKSDADAIGLQVFPIQYDKRSALFVAGSESEVKRAVELISDLENQIEASSGKRLFWYSAKHANADELAKVVSKVYRMLSEVGSESKKSNSEESDEQREVVADTNLVNGNVAPLVVSPSPLTGPSFDSGTKGVQKDGQIVVDAKSGALIMVVEPSFLPKIKELLAKLDTPKKMVRLDFLLFEKKLTDKTQFGLEQLHLGSAASRTNKTGFGFSEGILTNPAPINPVPGISHFFASHKGVPSFDLAYNFLLYQETVQINANPSVTTVNGTPTVVNLVDEISINTGSVPLDDGKGGTRYQDAYSRAQYGIMIKVTPTVHEKAPGEGDFSVTLETDITFDTPSSLTDPRPSVARRSIKNLVKVEDGKTIVLGGLRQKQSDDVQMQIPFFGELPGFGKFFSYSITTDVTKEMFIFMTPHVVEESSEQYRQAQLQEMKRRPGDTNEFIAAYRQSCEARKASVFSRSLQLIFGREREENRELPAQRAGEYDGRD